MPDAPPTPARRPALPTPSGWIIPAVFAVALLTALSLGPAEPIADRALALLATTLTAAWIPAAYLLGAIGWGLIARPWTRHLPAAAPLNAGIGLALTLTTTHALGVLGLLNTAAAWAWTGAGLILLVHQVRHIRTLPRLPDTPTRITIALASIGVAIMLVAAASPPGALWDSEFGGYDSLSYHLQLPAEWLEAGRITPAEHNVYAFLPGYYESAILHQAHLANTPKSTPEGLSGLLHHAGAPLIAAHHLALGCTLLAAWFAAAFTRTLAVRTQIPTAASNLASAAAAALILLTPWTQTVGSLAYNEPAMLALATASLLAAAVPDLTPTRRAVIVAFTMGVAAGCKPTAILFLAPAAAILMAANTPRRAWPVMFLTGAAVGLLTLAPWLIRNALFAANPIFPHANSLISHAHWAPDQSARYAAGHHFDGSWSQRIATLILPAAEPGSPPVVRWRGLTNPQWALTPAAALIALVLLLTRRPTRTSAAILSASLAAGLGSWFLFTHLQSRFLIPLLPLMATATALAVATLPARTRHITTAALLAASAFWSLSNFAAQRARDPNALLTLGPDVFTGRLPLEGLGDAVVWAGLNQSLPPGETVLLVGDATPIYLRRPVVYATVWDTHPLAEAMRARPGDPTGWTAELHAAGIRWVLVSFPELDRLAASAWNDPNLTPNAVAEWTDTLGTPVRAWPDQGRALFRLRSAP